ncbi:hypothetical protein O181_007021 [Austropuccinia psidii MF-1]|uniref:BED-type domain-containing protein n=1 Tax=Austropuccinia psidii MF-1 TaxID=1389203 RepID=A0A9Q3GH93_9BASI|nr:hypothetical protein [Austropuccinia psidii MF-1]
MAGLQLNVTSSIESGLQTLALYIREYQLHSMGDDLTSTDEYDDEDLFDGTASGAANSGCINDDRHQVKPPKRRRIRSDVYEYYESLTPNGEWVQDKSHFRYTYRCRHCTVLIAVLGRNTSNLNKHRSKCCGCFSAWESKCPGSIDPNLGAKLAAEEQIAALATDLYFERKQKLIEEVANLPQGTYLSAAINCWTTKDQTQSYVAMVGQWVDPIKYTFRKCLLSFETITGVHTGKALAWSVWESLSERGMCACHVLNLVAKDFLLHMGELTNEDYKFFDDYLFLKRAPIEDSKDEHPPMAQELQGSIKRVGNSYHCTSQNCKNRAFNEVMLETQEKSEALHCSMANDISCRVDIDSEIMPSLQPPGEIIALSISSPC